VITEARNEVIRLLGGVVAGMQQIVPKGYYPVTQGQKEVLMIKIICKMNKR
jgi:hypothetical protein